MPAYESCDTCTLYATRRQRVLVAAFGRTMQATGETAKQILDRYFTGVHRRHLTGLPLTTTKENN